MALAAGLCLTAAAVAFVLSHAPPEVTRYPSPMLDATELGSNTLGARICQAGETLPRGTTAIRVWLEAAIGPHVSAEAISGTHVVTHGVRGAGWTAGSVTIPVTRVTRRWSNVRVCVAFAQSRELVGLQIVQTASASAATARQGPLPSTRRQSTAAYREGPLPGRILVEYLRPGRESWWSLAVSVARRMGLGHAFSGPSVPLLAAALMLTVAIAVSRVILSELT
jgi:hypothetical protein